jgi:hypothetical protein
MRTQIFKAIFSAATCGLLFCSLLLASHPGTIRAATVYDSGGFETFVAAQTLDGQDPAPPLGNGPWRQDDGISMAEVTALNPIEGFQSVKITRAAGAAGNTRWGVVKPIVPGALENVVNIHFDMRVVRAANEYGPLFGIEAYDASSGTPKLIGSLLLDAAAKSYVTQRAPARLRARASMWTSFLITITASRSTLRTRPARCMWMVSGFIQKVLWMQPPALSQTHLW